MENWLSVGYAMVDPCYNKSVNPIKPLQIVHNLEPILQNIGLAAFPHAVGGAIWSLSQIL